MAVSSEYRYYILDLLSAMEGVSVRPMFGGAGIYLGGFMFALITGSDEFYFRVDDSNQPDYEEAGSVQLKPFEDKPMRMPYWQAPADLLEDEEEFVLWARKAWEAAKRVQNAKKSKKKKTT